MLLSDRPTAQCEREIRASRSAVWNLITDPTRIGELSPECRGGQWDQSDRPPVVGSTFTCANSWGPMTWRTTSTVVQWEPDRAFSWVVGSPDLPSATWRYQLHPTKTGGTRLVLAMEFGPGPSGTTSRIAQVPHKEEHVVAARTAEHNSNMAATLAAIESTLEATPSRPT